MPTPNDNLIKLHSNLTKKWQGFAVPFEQFQKDMQDEGNITKLHENLSSNWDGFDLSIDQFKSDMGYGVDTGVEGMPGGTESRFWHAQGDSWTRKGRSIQYGVADFAHNISDEKVKEDIFEYAKAGRIPLQSDNPEDYDPVISEAQQKLAELDKGRATYMPEAERRAQKAIDDYKDAPNTFKSLFLGKEGVNANEAYDDPNLKAIDDQRKEIANFIKAATTAKEILTTEGQFGLKKQVSDAYYGENNQWGERTRNKAAEVMNNLPQPTGFWGKAGAMAPDITGSAVGAVVAIWNPLAGKAIMDVNMASMALQSYGGTLYQIDNYAKETGKEIDEDTRQMVALSGALVEGLTERVRIPGILEPMQKYSGQMAKRLFVREAVKNPSIATNMVSNFLGNNKQLIKKFGAWIWDVIKMSNIQGLEEAAEEFTSQFAQDLLSYAYLNPEDRPGFTEMVGNAFDAAKMAYVSGPVFGLIGKFGKHKNIQRNRQQNGYVTLVQDSKGTTYEGLYETKDGKFVVADINGTEKTLNADEVGDISRFGTQDFEKLTRMAKKGNEITNELLATSELELERKHINSQVNAKTYQGDEQFPLMVDGVDQENPAVIITAQTIDGKRYQVIGGTVNNPSAANPMIGVDLKTGDKVFISNEQLSNVDIVPADQMRAELEMESSNRIRDKYKLQFIASEVQENFQPGDIINFNGQEAEIVDVTDPSQGVTIKVTDAKGNEQFATIPADQLEGMQQQGQPNADNPSENIIKTQTFTVGKNKYNYTEGQDGAIFIEFKDGKDDTKAIAAEVDDNLYDLVPVTEEVPIPNVPAFVKKKTNTVVRGINLVPKGQTNGEQAAPAGNKPIQPTATEATEQAAQGVEAEVQPSTQPVVEGAAETAAPVLEQQEPTNEQDVQGQPQVPGVRQEEAQAPEAEAGEVAPQGAAAGVVTEVEQPASETPTFAENARVEPEVWEMTNIEAVSKKSETAFPVDSKVEIIDGKPVYTSSTTIKWGDGEKTISISGKSQPSIEKLHKEVIKQAIADGKPVPAEVLADYPDLIPASQTPASPAVNDQVAGENGQYAPIKRGKDLWNFTGNVNEKNGDLEFASPTGQVMWVAKTAAKKVTDRSPSAGQHLENILVKNDIKDAEDKVNPEPTEKQKEAGNYAKGHVKVNGFDITIENPKGSTRSGVDGNGKPWSIEMQNTYGYFKKTNGKDGDQIDTFIGDNPTSEKVFVIDQVNPETGEFDESKVMMGFNTADEAKDAYMSNYSTGWNGFGSITETNIPDFKKWLYDGARQAKAYSEYADTPQPKPTTAGAKLDEILAKDKQAKADAAQKAADETQRAEKEKSDKEKEKAEKVAQAKERKAKRDALDLEAGNDYETEVNALLESGQLDLDELRELTIPELVARYSNNPLEIIGELVSVDHYIPESMLDFKETAIANHMAKVPASSVNSFGDRNKVGMSMAKAYFARKGEPSQTLDQIAQQSSGEYGANADESVTPEDVWNFMLRYPNGVSSFLRQISPEYKALKDRFYEVTGVDATKGIFDRAEKLLLEIQERKKQADNYRPNIDEFLGMTPEEMIEIEDDVSNLIASELANEDKNNVILSHEQEGENGTGAEIPGLGSESNQDGVRGEVRQEPSEPVQRDFETGNAKPRAEQIKNLEAEISRLKARASLANSEYNRIKKAYDKTKANKQARMDDKFIEGSDVIDFGDGAELAKQVQDAEKKLTVANANLKAAQDKLADAIKLNEAPDNQIDLFAEETPDTPPKPTTAGEKLDQILNKGKDEIQPETINEPSDKITDFGEKIEGARKDQIKKYFDKINLNGKILSTIFPKPDIKALLESGMSVKDVAGIKVAHEFATQDKKKGERVIKFYASYAKNILAESINLEYTGDGYVFTDFGKSQIDLRTKAYQDVYEKLGVDFLSLDLTKARIREADKSGRTTYYENSEPVKDINYIVQYYVSSSKYFKDLPDAISYFTELIKKNTTTSTVEYKRKLSVYRSLDDSGLFIAYKPSGKPLIKLREGIKTTKDAFDILKDADAVADIHTMLERVLAETKEENKRTITRLKYSNETARERVGKDWRNGKDIGSKELAETFGFRAIEFGNWVNQKERQVFMNNTYDSLMDLAQILEISPKAISLGGNLGITFGSRGSGKASAHFEPDRKIINLTKTKGLGSLAHEWWHAVDNYFNDFKTASKGMKAASNLEFKEGVRDEVKAAFTELYNAINKNSGMKQRSVNLDNSRNSNYFSLPHEMSARAFENFALKRLAESGQINDFIVNYVSQDDWKGEATKYPFPKGDESKPINEAFANLFNTIDTKTDEAGNEIMFRILGETGATNLDKAEEATTRMGNLSVAREMETAGKDAKAIRMATGWEKGADGKWKYELPDGDLKVSENEIAGLPKTNNEWFTDEIPLSDIIDMDNVMDAYPEVKDYKITFFNHGTHKELSSGSFADTQRGVVAISLSPDFGSTGQVISEQDRRSYAGYGGNPSVAYDKNSLQSAIVHEVQHLLQQAEGFNAGGNVEQVFRTALEDKLAEIGKEDWAKDYPKAKKRQLAEAYLFADRGIDTGSLSSDKLMLYAMLSGEVEARNAANRLNLTDAQRRETLLSETEDVSREDQIFLNNAMGTAQFKQEPDILSPFIQRANEIQERSQRAKELGKQFGVHVRVITNRNQLPTHIARKLAKNSIYPGIYDIRTDQVYILVNEAKDIPTIEKTIAHEIVAHKGLRDMLGQEAFDNLLSDVYDNMDLDAIAFIKDQYNTNDSKVIADEYMASLAETGKFPAWFGRTIAQVRSLLRKAGFNVEFTDADIMYLLWESRKRLLKEGGLNGYVEYKAKEDAVKANVRFSVENATGVEDGIADDLSTVKQAKKIASTINNNNVNQLLYKLSGILNNGTSKSIFGKYNESEGQFEYYVKDKKLKELMDNTSEMIETLEIILSHDKSVENITESAKNTLRNEIKKQQDNLATMERIYNGEDITPDNAVRFKISPSNTNNLDPRMIESKFNQKRELLQDKMLSGKILMETIKERGGKTPQSTDFYNAENRMQSRSMAMIEDFNNGELKKLSNTLADIVFKDHVSLDDINLYLKAKSSLERNDNEGISALSEDIADEWNRQHVEGIVADFESKVSTDTQKQLWDDIKTANDFTIKQLYLGNVISKSAYENMKARKYYVPLKSWQFKEGENPVDFYQYANSNGTAYQGLRKAHGRGSEAADPLAYIISAAHSAVVSANRNMMKHKFLMLARLNPDMKDLFNIKKVYVMENGTDVNGDPIYNDVIKDGEDAIAITGYDAADNPIMTNIGKFQEKYDDGTITSKVSKKHTSRRPKFIAAQHEVEVFENGERYIVATGDPNVANAINNANTFKPELTRAIQGAWYAGRATRWVSANFTAKNPAFIPINWIRDFGYASMSHLVKEDGNLAGFLKNQGASVAAIHRFNAGKAKPDKNAPKNSKAYKDYLYQQFREYGGETGFVHLREIKDLQKNIDKEINLIGGKRKGMDKVRQNKIYKLLGHSLDYMALMSENSARYATFLTSLESGKSYEQSATDAKNISVNFNRKGRASGLFGSMYAFFNANVQGGHNFAHMAKHNKKRMAVAATSFFTAGLMLAELLRYFGPEDEDGNKEYDKLPDWQRKDFLVIPTWGDGFVTIPLPFGFREIYGIGVTISDAMHGKVTGGEALFDMITSAASAFSPIQMTDNEIKKGRIPYRSVVPTVLVPFYDIRYNEDFTGRDLYKVPYVKGMERYTPNSELGAYNVNDIIKKAMQGLNRLGGGDENTPAGLVRKDGEVSFSGTRQLLFDWNPSKAEHLLEYYLGGRGRFFNNIYKTVEGAVSSEKEVETYNIPVFRRLYTVPYKGGTWNDYMDIRTEVEDFKHVLKDARQTRDWELVKEMQQNKRMMRTVNMFESTDKTVKDMSELIKVLPDEQSRKKVRESREQRMKQFIKQLQQMNESDKSDN